MSGSNYTVECSNCHQLNVVHGKAMTLAMTCQSCQKYFRLNNWNKNTETFNDYSTHQYIPLHARGRFDKFVYEVMGFVVKEERKYRYKWREYLLFNPYRGFIFLSEYNGHWNLVTPIEHEPGTKVPGEDEIYYEGENFLLYQKYTAQVIYAKGEFFFDVVDITDSTVNSEYIAPPRLLALERSEDSVLWCEGEYLTPKQVAEAFSMPVSQLPHKEGMGYTEPLNTKFSDNTLIIWSVIMFGVILILQLMFNNTAEEKVVFQGDFQEKDMNDQKVLVTPSFELTEGYQTVEILLSAGLSNDWFFSEFSLINELNGDEYNFTKEIEYYYGSTGGESWTEGSRNGEAFLSQIPGGKYHLNIYPQFSAMNHSFSLTIIRDAPMSSNFFISCVLLALFPIGYFIRKRMKEQQRWSDSDYSPYETEE